MVFRIARNRKCKPNKQRTPPILNTGYFPLSHPLGLRRPLFFFDLIEMPVATPIPWKCWGPLNTRIFQHPSLESGCEVHLSGNRVLLLCPIRDPYSECNSLSRRKLMFNGKYKLHIMDFSPLAVANRQGLGRMVGKPSTFNVADPKCARKGYEERLTTFLPYVEVVLDRKF